MCSSGAFFFFFRFSVAQGDTRITSRVPTGPLDACIFGPSDPTHPSWPTGADDGRIADWNPYQSINGTMGDRVAHGGDVSPPDRSIGFGLVVAVVDSPHRLGLGVAGV